MGFGDGNSSSEVNPYIMYSSPGHYLVTLSVNNDSTQIVMIFYRK